VVIYKQICMAIAMKYTIYLDGARQLAAEMGAVREAPVPGAQSCLLLTFLCPFPCALYLLEIAGCTGLFVTCSRFLPLAETDLVLAALDL
jgi:hypothetical protein